MRTALGVSKSGNPSASCLAASPLCHVASIMGCAYVRMLRTYCFSLNQPEIDGPMQATQQCSKNRPRPNLCHVKKKERERETEGAKKW